MTYLVAYLAIGVASLAAVLVAHRWRKPGLVDSVRKSLDEMDPRYGTLSYRFLNHVLAPTLAGLFVIIVWPIAVLMQARDWLPHKAPEADAVGASELELNADHLQDQLSVEQVEAEETVRDPLGAAPAVPFGFLNPIWKAFLAKRQAGDELWSYYALWMRLGMVKQADFGYVWVRNGMLGEQMPMGRRVIRIDKPVSDEEIAALRDKICQKLARGKAARAG